jgi:hypothetical protein
MWKEVCAQVSSKLPLRGVLINLAIFSIVTLTDIAINSRSCTRQTPASLTIHLSQKTCLLPTQVTIAQSAHCPPKTFLAPLYATHPRI